MLNTYLQISAKRKMKTRTKYLFLLLVLIAIVNYFGVFLHLFEKDYYANFEYPLNEDIVPLIDQLKNNDIPSVPPINMYNYSFLKSCEDKCEKLTSLRLVIVIKSAMNHFERRQVIRNTFGYERRFSDVIIRTIFLLGIKNSNNHDKLQKSIDKENENHKDIVQADFIDSYFNNTIKTMMGFKWIVKYCPNASFYLFSDDDMYVSIKNLLRFVRNPSHYPEYIEESLSAIRKISRQKRSFTYSSNLNSKSVYNQSAVANLTTKYQSEDIHPKPLRYFVKRHIQNNYELPDDVILYAGFQFVSSPHRHKSSKWYISLNEYPWHMWPPYISAGAYVLSKEALTTMYYGSFYTAHFRFDDIYLGILAKKCDITPFHSKEFYFYKKDYNSYNYRYVIASHGYSDPSELLKVWNEQRAAGNA